MADAARIEAKIKEWTAQQDGARKELDGIRARANELATFCTQLDGAIAGAKQLLAAESPPTPAPKEA